MLSTTPNILQIRQNLKVISKRIPYSFVWRTNFLFISHFNILFLSTCGPEENRTLHKNLAKVSRQPWYMRAQIGTDLKDTDISLTHLVPYLRDMTYMWFRRESNLSRWTPQIRHHPYNSELATHIDYSWCLLLSHLQILPSGALVPTCRNLSVWTIDPRAGFEPTTCALQVHCSTNWTNREYYLSSGLWTWVSTPNAFQRRLDRSVLYILNYR